MTDQTMTNNQDWIQLMLSTTAEDSESLGDILSELGALAVTFQDIGDEPIYEPLPGEHRFWSQTHVIGLFASDTDTDKLIVTLKKRLDSDTLPECRIQRLADRDWERVWLEHFKPMQFGPRLWVCPTHTTPPDPDAVNLMLDPGLAFGTGTHPTTAQCLEALAEIDVAGRRVLDYGCGSGILAIAAALLGAETVWAIDIDRQALLATTENARRNAVSQRIETGLPGEQAAEPKFDILLANILSGPLIELAETLAKQVAPTGTLILSGILVEQADELIRHYGTWFQFEPRRQHQEWACLVARRSGQDLVS
jgi:ribosomal protein L11 methyltransferase